MLNTSKTGGIIHFPPNCLHSGGLSLIMAKTRIFQLWVIATNKTRSNNSDWQKHCFPFYRLACWPFSLVCTCEVTFSLQQKILTLLSHYFPFAPLIDSLVWQICKLLGIWGWPSYYTVWSPKYILYFTQLFYSKANIYILSLNTPLWNLKMNKSNIIMHEEDW